MAINKQRDPDLKEGIIAGRNPVMEALKIDAKIDKLFVARGEREGSIVRIIALAKEKGIPISEADKVKLDHISGIKNHQGVVAYINSVEYYSVEEIINSAKEAGEAPVVIVAENLTDPHNLGAIARTAEASGIHGIIIPKNRSVGITPVVVKASAGALMHVKVARVSNIPQTLDKLKDLGLWVYGTAAEAEKNFYETDLTGAAAFVIGNEGEGMSRLVRDKCDFLVSIPMQGKVSSLNASVAAALLMYEAYRQKINK